MRIVIDPERCQGHARCAARAPDLFRLDAMGWAIAPDRVPEEAEARARLAARSCPERAIAVIEDQPSDS